MITFAVESWYGVVGEMRELWDAHWKEVALNRDVIKLDPDIEAYENMQDTGMLHIVVARSVGEVVGYHITIVRPHLHYKESLSGIADVYYLKPEHRQGMTAIKMFKFVESTLKARGVQKLFTGTKLSLDMGPIFERMGWVEQERLYSKVI